MSIEAVCIVHVKMYFVDCLYQMHAVGLWRLVYIIPQLHHLDRIRQECAVVQIFSNAVRNSNDDRARLTGNGAILRLDGGLEPNHTLFVAALTKMQRPEPF